MNKTFIHQLVKPKVIRKNDLDEDFNLRIIAGLDEYDTINQLKKNFISDEILFNEGGKLLVNVPHGFEGNNARKITFKNIYVGNVSPGSVVCKASVSNNQIVSINNDNVINVTEDIHNNYFTVELMYQTIFPDEMYQTTDFDQFSDTYKTILASLTVAEDYFIIPGVYLIYEINKI